MSRSALIAYVRYLAPGTDRPVYHASRGGTDARLDIEARFEDRKIEIHDARLLEPPASLDRQGFTLVRQATRVENFYAAEVLQSVYEAEISDLVRSTTGARAARVFDHTLRSDSPTVRGKRSSREPAAVVHNDYTDASAVKRLRAVLPRQEAEEWLRRRFAIVNVWRPISNPVLNSPLACCDAATIEAADLVTTERRAHDRTGELQLVRWNPAHRWYWYPAMTPDETLLIKTFDSSLDGPARRSIHTAFQNPSAPADAPARESIESRLFVSF